MFRFLQRQRKLAVISTGDFQYFIKLPGTPEGPYPIDELRQIPGFTLRVTLRKSPDEEWKPAFKVLDLKAYFVTTTKNISWSNAVKQAKNEAARRTRRRARSRMIQGVMKS